MDGVGGAQAGTQASGDPSTVLIPLPTVPSWSRLTLLLQQAQCTLLHWHLCELSLFKTTGQSCICGAICVKSR